jgi:hypothetical protein
MELIGCRGEAAPTKQLARGKSNSVSVVASKDSTPTPFVSKRARTSPGEAHREAFLSTYNNPESGISFRYPRNYALEEGDVQERSFFLKTQEDLDLEQAGATLVATVLIPEDGYPNTTFEHGSLQLVTDESVSEKACRDGVTARPNAYGSGSVAVQGTAFFWSEEASETGGVKLMQRTYAGYSQGTCYEFLLTIAADETAVHEAPEPETRNYETTDPENFRKPADMAKIMKQLEKIVSSSQLFRKSLAPPPETTEETADRL